MTARAHLFMTAVVAMLTMVDFLHAQTVKVAPKPGDGEWTVSFSRRHNPEIFELDSFHATIDAAKKRAQALTAWSDGMKPSSSWMLAVILIEGEDAKAESPVDRTNAEPPRAPLKPNRKGGDVLREYKRTIEAAYENAKRAKTDLLGRTGRVSETTFNDVNRVIGSYNKQRDATKESSGFFFSSAPPLTAVTPRQLKGTLTKDDSAGSVDDAKPKSAMTLDVHGTKWLNTKNNWSYRFERDGRLLTFDPSGALYDTGGTTYTWRQDGKEIFTRASGSKEVFFMTIDGGGETGSDSNSRRFEKRE